MEMRRMDGAARGAGAAESARVAENSTRGAAGAEIAGAEENLARSVEAGNAGVKRLAVGLAVIGGGPAGLAAALEAAKQGVRDILILERDNVLGGILNQCIHNGFGLHTFQEELTGPEYAARFVEQVEELGILYRLETMVTDIRATEYGKEITAVSRKDGLTVICAQAVILAMGCRERPRGALNIPGFRPAGIYSAGTAQRLVNMEGQMPGREVVILGSGDIGLIMARRMTLEGAKVKAVAEVMPYSGGLKRNIVQCLEDYGIPLKLSTTVVRIHGKERVEGVTLAKVDERRNTIPGTEEFFACDTLLLSVGLIPENELTEGLGAEMSGCTHGPVVNESMETSVEGVFACGNVLHVHDLVDYVSQEAAMAGRAAAVYLGEKAGCAEHGMPVSGGHASRESVAGAENAKTAAAGQGELAAPGHGMPVSGGHMDCEPITGAENAKTAATGQDELAAPGHEPVVPAVLVIPGAHVRYTVPSFIRPSYADTETLIRFRVDDVLQDRCVCVSLDGEQILRRKKRILAPGEMEQVTIKKTDLISRPGLTEITISIEA
ncbi:MAG: FAD-dependent oxidoreductase [Eubacteriales bacterium]|nr:FAD-dependent oxidoreductase [Eubacteriales bacterium]